MLIGDSQALLNCIEFLWLGSHFHFNTGRLLNIMKKTFLIFSCNTRKIKFKQWQRVHSILSVCLQLPFQCTMCLVTSTRTNLETLVPALSCGFWQLLWMTFLSGEKSCTHKTIATTAHYKTTLQLCHCQSLIANKKKPTFELK